MGQRPAKMEFHRHRKLSKTKKLDKNARQKFLTSLARSLFAARLPLDERTIKIFKHTKDLQRAHLPLTLTENGFERAPKIIFSYSQSGTFHA